MQSPVELYNSGLSLREVAEKLQTSTYQVIKKLIEAGICLRTKSESAKISYQKGRKPYNKGVPASEEFKKKVSEIVRKKNAAKNKDSDKGSDRGDSGTNFAISE